MNDFLLKLAVEYNLLAPDADLTTMDDCDLYAILCMELETRFQMETALKETFTMLGKRNKKILSDKVSLQTKIWYSQWLLLPKESKV